MGLFDLAKGGAGDGGGTSPPRRSKRRERQEARKSAKEQEGGGEGEEDEEDEDEEDNPDVQHAEDLNEVGGILGPEHTKKLKAGDHVLITAGPDEAVEEPMPWHGGRPDKDKYGLDPKSGCFVGAFVKPWMRVPKGGYRKPANRDSTDIKASRTLTALWGVCFVAGVYSGIFGDMAVLKSGGRDMVGNTCGASAKEKPPATIMRHLQQDWSDLKYLWFPIDPEYLGVGLENVTKHGVCVSQCPTFDPAIPPYELVNRGVKAYLWENKISEFKLDCPNTECGRRNYCARTGNFVEDLEFGCVRAFRVLYRTTLLHNQCVPDVYTNGTRSASPEVGALMSDVSAASKFHEDWWFSVTADCAAARDLILIGSCLTFLFGEIYLILVKWNPLRVAWASVVLLLASAIGTSLLLFQHSKMLETTEVPGLVMRKRYENQFKTFGYVLIVVASVNAAVCLMLRKKVYIASDMMVEANRVLKESPYIFLVAPSMFVIQLFVVGLAYYTILLVGSLASSDPISDGRTFSNIHRLATLYHIDPQSFGLVFYRTPFQVLCIVAVMWSMGFVNMVGYSMTTFISVMWYFSKPGSIKAPPKNGLIIAAKCMYKHTGSCAVGAVILTLFEGVRGYLDKLQAVLKRILDELPRQLFIFTCLIHYILMLFDKGLKLVRRDAFVIQCIEGSDFLHAARRAGRMYDKYKDEIKVITEVSENVALFGRLGILSITLFWSTFLLLETPMGDDIDNPVIIIIIITLNAYFVATLFVQMTNATMDSFLMCYCYDMDVNDGSKRRPYYTHPSLKILIDKHAKHKNEYRNIHRSGLKDQLTLKNMLHQVVDAQRVVQETMKDVEKTTRDTAKLATKAARTAAEEAEKAAKMGADMSKKVVKQVEKAAGETKKTVDAAATQGMKGTQGLAKKGNILTKKLGNLTSEVEKTKTAAGMQKKGRQKNKYATEARSTSPGQGSGLQGRTSSFARQGSRYSPSRGPASRAPSLSSAGGASRHESLRKS